MSYKWQRARRKSTYNIHYVTRCENVQFGMQGRTFRKDLLLPTSERLLFSKNTIVKVQFNGQTQKGTAIDAGNDVSRRECFTFLSSINIKMVKYRSDKCAERDVRHGASKKLFTSKSEGKFVEQQARKFNPLKTRRRPIFLKTQSVPRCKHFSSRL